MWFSCVTISSFTSVFLSPNVNETVSARWSHGSEWSISIPPSRKVMLLGRIALVFCVLDHSVLVYSHDHIVKNSVLKSESVYCWRKGFLVFCTWIDFIVSSMLSSN